MHSLTLAVIVVTFNARELLLQCLKSVCDDAERTGRSYQVIVVDNASADGSAAAIRDAFPTVQLIANTTNVGLAPALNQGLLACVDAKYVLLMNSDIKVRPGTLGPMMEYLEEHLDVAGVSTQLVNPDGSAQKFRTSFGLFVWPERLDRVFPVTFFGTTFHMGRREMYNEDQVGHFDEYYFFFNEDIDWSLRAHRRGLVFNFLPDLPVIHYTGQGRAQNRGTLLSELYRMNLYFYAKFFGRSITRLVYFFQTGELWGRLAYLWLAGKLNSIDGVAYRLALEKQRLFMDSLSLTGP